MSASHFKSMIPNDNFRDNFDNIFKKDSSNAIVTPEQVIRATEDLSEEVSGDNPRDCIG